MTLGQKLRALDDMDDSESQTRKTTLCRELRALIAKNDFGS